MKRFGNGLRDQHPVEGVFVMIGQQGKGKSMFRGYRQWFEATFTYPGHKFCRNGIELAETGLDEIKKGTGYFSCPHFFGLPFGLIVDSSPSCSQILARHSRPPKGAPLLILCCILSSSPSVKGVFTYSVH